MSNINSVIRIVFLPLAIAALSGCASVQAPDGYLPDASGTQWDVYGGWITVDYGEKDSINTVEGEFIGFQDSVVYILTESDLFTIRYEKVRSASLDVNTRQTGLFAGWTLLGTLSTASHGWYFILSAPLWLLTGIPSTVSASYDGRYADDHPGIAWWQSVTKFSRFPQGIPKGVDLNRLKLKRYPHE